MSQIGGGRGRDFGRVTVALLIAPLSPGVAISAMLTLWVVLTGGSVGDVVSSAISSLALGLFFSMALGYPVALLFALPVNTILSVYGQRRCSTYATMYSMLGIAGWLLTLLILYVTDYHPLPGMFRSPACAFALGAPCGAVAGTTFWLIARPDRFAKLELSPGQTERQLACRSVNS